MNLSVLGLAFYQALSFRSNIYIYIWTRHVILAMKIVEVTLKFFIVHPQSYRKNKNKKRAIPP